VRWLSLSVAILLAFAVAIAAEPASADAGAGGKGGTPTPTYTISLNQANPRLGDWVTFSYSQVPHVKDLRVEIICSEMISGVNTLVYGEAGPADQSFLLGGAGSLWLYEYPTTSVACLATLYSWDFHPSETFIAYAKTTFSAAGKN
jgi:hypothetical protein